MVGSPRLLRAIVLPLTFILKVLASHSIHVTFIYAALLLTSCLYSSMRKLLLYHLFAISRRTICTSVVGVK